MEEDSQCSLTLVYQWTPQRGTHTHTHTALFNLQCHVLRFNFCGTDVHHNEATFWQPDKESREEGGCWRGP